MKNQRERAREIERERKKERMRAGIRIKKSKKEELERKKETNLGAKSKVVHKKSNRKLFLSNPLNWRIRPSLGEYFA